LYDYVGIGNINIFGLVSDIKVINSYVGIGTLFGIVGSLEKQTNSYVGFGTILTILGSSDSSTITIPEETLLIQISGIASTKFESKYSYIGTGIKTIFGSGFTEKLSSVSESGIGVITLSGELIYPDVKYIPAPKGSGLISITGIAAESISYVDPLLGLKSLFAFSGGRESFIPTTYIGIGTIYFEDQVASAISNPYQPPNTYVVII
jgi:hypothetical protein